MKKNPDEEDNLPAEISQELDFEGFEPKWVSVDKLPGYVSRTIREYTQQWFNNYTNVDTIGDMNFISTFTNPTDHVKVVMKWVQQNAQKIDDAKIDFNLIPGYRTEGQLYVTDSTNFMIARDFVDDELAGYYVYMWPRDENEQKSIEN